MKRVTCLLHLLFAAAAVYPTVEFAGLDLGSGDVLLFRATAQAPRRGSFDTLFTSGLSERSIRQLTFFPEHVSLVAGRLQVQNRYGVFRSDAAFASLAPVASFPAFATGAPVTVGKINPLQTSPDGRYLLFTERTTDLSGNLTLIDVSTGARTVISRSVAYSPSGPLARWSPDSKFLIYVKNGLIFYYSLEQLAEDRVIAERFREIGPGTIASAQWAPGGDLYYVEDTMVYRLDSRELFTRSLYAGLLRIGRIVGKLPLAFDANLDSFYIAPGGRWLLLDKAGRNLLLHDLAASHASRADDAARTASARTATVSGGPIGSATASTAATTAAGGAVSVPHLLLSRDATLQRVVWSVDQQLVTVLVVDGPVGERSGRIFRARLDVDSALERRFTPTDDEGIFDLFVSPNASQVALLRAGSVEIRTLQTWRRITSVPHTAPLRAVWVSTERLVIAGAQTIELYDMSEQQTRLVALSRADAAGYAEDGTTAIVRVGERRFALAGAAAGGGPTWSPTELVVREPVTASAAYRVFADRSTGIYKNMIMIRDLRALVTLPLADAELTELEPLPAADQPIDPENFRHGSRLRRRELALVFNAIDSEVGLPMVLRTLEDYDINATFFVNGEFIRRHPDATRDLARSGHEVGSLFFAHFNMTDSRFRIDREFVRSGLARNEDEYFDATGAELTTLWHAPFYFVTSELRKAAAQMNYRYIGRDVDSLDWVTRDDTAAVAGVYMDANALAARILERKRPGSIVPIRIGVPLGRRDDYLFQRLDALIDALLKRGYDIVNVSTLIEHAR